MNFIKQLESENKQLKETIVNCQNELSSFNVFLHGPKFVGTESNGERKDWISTSDMIFAIREFQRILGESGIQ